MTDVNSSPPGPRPPVSQRARWTMGIGAGLFFLAMIVYGLLKPSDEQPQVTRAEFNAALQKWKESGIKSYDLRLGLSGHVAHNSEIILEVRNGRVTKCLFDGKPENKKDEDAWTIDKQFRYIAADLDKAEDPNEGFATKKGVRITLHATFDPTYGYPDHYFRKAHGASPLHQQWKAQSFKVIPPE